MHWNDQLRACLALNDVNGVAMNMLRPHAYNVASALSGIEQQAQRETFARSRAPMFEKGRDVDVRPCHEAIARFLEPFDTLARLVRTQFKFDKQTRTGRSTPSTSFPVSALETKRRS